MTTDVHYSYHSGLSQIPIINPTQNTTDSILAHTEPKLGGGIEEVGSQVTLSAAPARTGCIRIQVEDGGKVRYEILNEANSTVASASSMAMTGEVTLPFSQGWQLSLIEAS